MKNLLQHPDFGQIRIQKVKEDFVYCAKDICDVLNLTNAAETLRNLDDDEKLISVIVSSGQRRELLFITESGLYALILRSRKPEAKRFRKWVTAEVLPNLRKYGVYSTDERIMENAKKRAEVRAKKELFKEIDRNLSVTDKRIIAKQCYATEYEVNRVLSGDKEDVYMATLLFNKAIGNKELHSEFYSLKGAADMLKVLLTHKKIER